MTKLSQDKTEIFESIPIPRAVMTLCIPSVAGTLVMVLYNLADTFFVGMINDPVQTAAVSLAAPVLLAFNAVNNLFGIGTSSMMSRALGQKHYDTVKRSSAIGFYSSLTISVIIALLYTAFRGFVLNGLGADAVTAAATGEYLFWTVTCGSVPAILNVVLGFLVRSDGSAMHGAIGTMSGCLLNIILDPIFILPWGLNMGAAGAGCATFISNCAACLYFLILLYVRRGTSLVNADFRNLKGSLPLLAGICAVGVPASLQNLFNVTGMTILNNFTSAYGADAVAAMGITHKINMIPLYIALGTSQGIMPLISYNYASGNKKRVKDTIFFTYRITLSFMVLMTLGFYFGAESIVGSFMDNPSIIAYGARFLRAFCLVLPFLNTDFLAVGVFQACGMGKRTLIFAVLRKIVLEIPALFILERIYPLYGLPYAQVFAEVILATAALVMIRKLFTPVV